MSVLHAAGGSSSAHARNMPENMRDPKNYNFNAQHSIKFLENGPILFRAK